MAVKRNLDTCLMTACGKRGGLCTFAYTISLKGAQYLLQRAFVRSEKPIDHVLHYETLMGHLVSFRADPPLAYTSSHGLVSSLAY